jgi:hypothetical protein
MGDFLIARIDSFTPAGRYVVRGQPVKRSEVEDAEGNIGDNFIDAPASYEGNAVVEVSAIAPTGPNPKNPQQIAPDVVQTTEGYVQHGATLVGEVTLPEKQRIEIVGIDPDSTVQADVAKALADADAKDAGKNVDNAGTEGTVPEISARVAEMDAAALDSLYAAENDREVPRKGVISAIEARRAALEA